MSMPSFVARFGLNRDCETPAILLDRSAVASNYLAVNKAFGKNCEIFFSVKANNQPAILKTIGLLGGGFDVASWSEAKQVLDLGIHPDRLIFSNPIKKSGDISDAFAAGLRFFAFDSRAEIEKLAKHAPGSSVYVRIAADNSGSGWPLAKKFGAAADGAVELLGGAASLGLKPVGVTFHVGSQCLSAASWRPAIERAAKVWRAAGEAGIGLSVLDIGGGLPAAYRNDEPTVDEIGRLVRESVAASFVGNQPSRLIVEPGRFLVADAGALVASVIGRARRGDRNLVYLDVGLFNGLMEAYEHFWYPIECLFADGAAAREVETVTLYGPTCDSVDCVVENIPLPRLEVGDKVVFGQAGAYTCSYESYNGFAFPKPVII